MFFSKINKNFNSNHTHLPKDKKILFRCLNCGFEEHIPKFIVTILDFFDRGDPAFPPRFSCQFCSGHMHPVFYENRKGITYKL